MPKLVLPKAKPKGKAVRTSTVWHISYYCRIRRKCRRISTHCRDYRRAERRLREFTGLLELGRVGLQSPFKVQPVVDNSHRLKLDECLKVYEEDLRAGRVRARGRRVPVGESHVKLSMARLRIVFDGIGVTNAGDIKIEAVNRFFDNAAKSGDIASAQTRKHYERSVKAFSRWLYTSERLPADPLARMMVTYVGEEDIVHPRTEFSLAEVEKIMAGAAAGEILCGMTGPQRALLYATAAGTGFRAKELRIIRKEHFAPDFSFVTMAGVHTKNRKKVSHQPIPPALRPALAALCSGLAPDAVLWPLLEGDAIDLLRADAAGTGIVIGRKNSDGSGVRDFHSFRHTYISNLSRAGLSDNLRLRLARATGGVVERYTHQDVADVQRAADRMLVPDVSSLGLSVAVSDAAKED